MLSTLNDLDGVGNETGELIASTFFLNADGHWAGARPTPHAEPCDEQVQLTDKYSEGLPYFIQTNDGRVFSGRIGNDGFLPRIDTFGEDEYLLLWGDEALAKTEAQAND